MPFAAASHRVSAGLIREALAADVDLLWQLLALAGQEPSVAAARSVPVVAMHLAGWRRPCDFGVICEQDGEVAGAAWARQFSADESPTFFVGAGVPELTIAVHPHARRAGIGTALLAALGALARANGCKGLCLNVRDSNPGIRLYERAGYRRVAGAEVRNRVGGLSLGMVLMF